MTRPTLRDRFEKWAKRNERWLCLDERDATYPNEYQYVEGEIALAAYQAGYRAGKREKGRKP